MDMTYEEYTAFINHLFLQEFLDEDYHYEADTSTAYSLAIL